MPDLKFDRDLAKFTPRQIEAVKLLDSGQVKFLLYGGALGGGKSYFLRWYGIRRLMRLAEMGFKHCTAMLACEDYPSLKDRQLSKIPREVPPELGTMHQDHKEYGKCLILAPEFGSGALCFRNLDDPSKYQCYHPDTEILTRDRGFVPVAEVEKGEHVATMNPATQEAGFLPVSATQEYDFNGDLVVSDDPKAHVQFSVTPSHKMLFHTRRRKDLRFGEAQELPERFYVPRSACFGGEMIETLAIPQVPLGRNKKEITFKIRPFLRFLGWFLSEGSLGSRTRYEVKISQQKEDGLKQLVEDLEAFPYRFYSDHHGIRCHGKALFNYLSQFGKCYDKFIPADILNLHPELLQELFGSLMAGDGHLTKEGRWVFATTSRRLADDVSILAIRLGMVPTIVPIKDFKTGRYPNAAPMWHVSITSRATSMCNRVRRAPYQGKVHCVTVPPHHTVLTRYNNRVMWCGQSAEFVLIMVDELTKNPYDTFTQLRMRLRWPGLADEECQFVGGSNPGGVGHGWVKSFWIDKIFSPEWINPRDYRPSFAFVPSKADDNPHLDAAYWAMLDTLPVGLREAFRDGSWSTFIGQAFPELSEVIHGIDPIWPIPENAPLYMTYDWGFGKPFSFGWWWMDNDGRAMRFGEWYGASGPNRGIRLGDSEVAEGVIDREVKLGLAHFSTPGDYLSVSWDREIIRYAGPDCFAKRPDYKGGGQGPSTAEVFSQYGVHMMPGDPDRALRIRQFRERLRSKDGETPMMLIYKSCGDFFRTVSSLVMDKNRPEDIDSDGEDHQYDEACFLCMARPLSAWLPQPPKTGPQLIIEAAEQRIPVDILPWEIPAGDGEENFLDGEKW